MTHIDKSIFIVQLQCSRDQLTCPLSQQWDSLFNFHSWPTIAWVQHFSNYKNSSLCHETISFCRLVWSQGSELKIMEPHSPPPLATLNIWVCKHREERFWRSCAMTSGRQWIDTRDGAHMHVTKSSMLPSLHWQTLEVVKAYWEGGLVWERDWWFTIALFPDFHPLLMVASTMPLERGRAQEVLSRATRSGRQRVGRHKGQSPITRDKISRSSHFVFAYWN